MEAIEAVAEFDNSRDVNEGIAANPPAINAPENAPLTRDEFALLTVAVEDHGPQTPPDQTSRYETPHRPGTPPITGARFPGPRAARADLWPILEAMPKQSAGC